MTWSLGIVAIKQKQLLSVFAEFWNANKYPPHFFVSVFTVKVSVLIYKHTRRSHICQEFSGMLTSCIVWWTALCRQVKCFSSEWPHERRSVSMKAGNHWNHENYTRAINAKRYTSTRNWLKRRFKWFSWALFIGNVYMAASSKCFYIWQNLSRVRLRYTRWSKQIIR